MQCSDALPLLSPRFLSSLDDTIPCACIRLSHEARRRPGAWSFRVWQLHNASLQNGNDRDSQVPGEPLCAHAMFSDPGRTSAPLATAMQRHGPRSFNDEGSQQEVISGLNRTASALAVYASPGGLPAQDARLASGRWPSSPGRDWLPAGFLTKGFRSNRYISSPFPKLCLAQSASPFLFRNPQPFPAL